MAYSLNSSVVLCFRFLGSMFSSRNWASVPIVVGATIIFSTLAYHTDLREIRKMINEVLTFKLKNIHKLTWCFMYNIMLSVNVLTVAATLT